MGSTGGGQFGQNNQKLHENYKIGIFWVKTVAGDLGGQTSNSPLGETLLYIYIYIYIYIYVVYVVMSVIQVEKQQCLFLMPSLANCYHK